MIVAGIDLDRRYTLEEVTEMYHSGKYKSVVLEGYIVRAGDDGLVGFVPWYESSLFRSENDQAVRHDFGPDAERMREDVERENPIQRRSPYERVIPVWMRILAQQARTGSTGLPNELITEIVGASWKEGEPLTAEEARQVAVHFLSKAERTNREADAKRVTRQHMTA